MAEYTSIVEAGSALVELLRDNMSPEPVANREQIALCSPHNSENNQLTVYLYSVEEDQHSTQRGFYHYSPTEDRAYPSQLILSFLITAHSKAPVQLREADQYRMIGRVVQLVRDNPAIEQKYLTGSLRDTAAQLHLSLEKQTFEQMIKIWNNTSTPYKLSLVVRIAGVTIDSRIAKQVSRVTDVEMEIKSRK